jgi:hypothetical protein
MGDKSAQDPEELLIEEAPTCGRSFFLRKKPWGLLPPNPHCHSSPASGWGILAFSRKFRKYY